MTAFLRVDVPWAPAAPANLRETLCRADGSRPMLPARRNCAPGTPLAWRWRTDDPAPEFPPD